MPTCNYTCRKARADDDIRAIARCIYLTDPYIYPTIAPDPAGSEWLALIRQSFCTPGNLFYHENISVVESRGTIVGLACVIACGEACSFSESVCVPPPLRRGVEIAEQGYFQPLFKENLLLNGANFVNVCIDEDHRGKGAGSCLMEFCVAEYGKHHMHLDVLLDNQAAVGLYEKFGFRKQYEYFGFSAGPEPIRCWHMERNADMR